MSEIMTVENLKQAFPDLYGAIEKAAYDRGFEAGIAQGRSAGLIEGAESERNRIRAVEDQLIPGHEDLVSAMKYDGSTSGPEAAVKILSAEKTLRSVKLAAFTEEHAAVAAPAVPVDDKPVQDDEANLPVEERTKAVWNRTPSIRAEFGTYEKYLAFERASASGKVKILSREGGK